MNGVEVECSNSLYQPSWTVISPRTTCSGRAFLVFNRLPSEAPTSTGILISSTAPRTELQPDQVSDIEVAEGRAFFFNSSALFALSGDTAAVWSSGNRARAAHAEGA